MLFPEREVSGDYTCIINAKSGYNLQRFLRMCSYCRGHLYVAIQCNGHGTLKGCLWALGRQSGASVLSMLKAAKQNHI